MTWRTCFAGQDSVSKRYIPLRPLWLQIEELHAPLQIKHPSPPPQVLHNQPLSYPADLWALGCIVYQMLVGQAPFKAGSEYLTFQKVSVGHERTFAFPGPSFGYPF